VQIKAIFHKRFYTRTRLEIEVQGTLKMAYLVNCWNFVKKAYKEMNSEIALEIQKDRQLV